MKNRYIEVVPVLDEEKELTYGAIRFTSIFVMFAFGVGLLARAQQIIAGEPSGLPSFVPAALAIGFAAATILATVGHLLFRKQRSLNAAARRYQNRTSNHYQYETHGY